MIEGGDTAAAIAAGLPNITGDFRSVDVGDWEGASGAFIAENTGGGQTTLGSAHYDATVSFDASRSSSIYGASSTVQPPAIQLIPQLKI